MSEEGRPRDPAVAQALQMTINDWPVPLEEVELDLLRQVGQSDWEFALGFYRLAGELRTGWEQPTFLLWGRLALAAVRRDAKESLAILRCFGMKFRRLPEREAAVLLEQAAALAQYHVRLPKPFLEAAPRIDHPDAWYRLGERLAAQHWPGAESYFFQTPHFLTAGGTDLVRWGEEGESFGRWGLELPAVFFGVTPRLWPDWQSLWSEWLRLGNELAGGDPGLARAFFEACPRLVGVFPWDMVRHWGEAALGVWERHGLDPATAYLASGPNLLRRLSGQPLEKWIEGATAATSPKALRAYFALDTSLARDNVRAWQQGVELEEVEPALRTLGEAISGREMRIRSLSDLPEELVHGWESGGDGVRIYLQSFENRGQDRESNRRLYRRAFLHELAHLMYDTHRIFARSEDANSPFAAACRDGEGCERLLAAYHRLEDARVETCLQAHYPGFLPDTASSAVNIPAGWADSLATAAQTTPGGGSGQTGLLPDLSALAQAAALGDHPTPLQHRLWDLLAKFRLEEGQDAGYRSLRFYPEWDNTRDDYLPQWCRVGEKGVPPGRPGLVEQILTEHHGLVSSLKRIFTYFRPERPARFFRQPEGEHLDLDAVLEEMSANHGKLIGDGLYVRRDKNLRETAAALLLDLSESTDTIVKGDKSILRLETEAAVVLAECLQELGDNFAVYGFQSDERLRVDFQVVKDFGETYEPSVRNRFSGLRAGGATRLGAALRHACAKLRAQPAAVRLLLLLSDGRPWDFDYHHQGQGTGRDDYPEADCRVALQEARRQGVNAFCITIDSRGYQYLEDIFGPSGYLICQAAEQLPRILPSVYRKLTC